MGWIDNIPVKKASAGSWIDSVPPKGDSPLAPLTLGQEAEMFFRSIRPSFSPETGEEEGAKVGPLDILLKGGVKAGAVTAKELLNQKNAPPLALNPLGISPQTAKDLPRKILHEINNPRYYGYQDMLMEEATRRAPEFVAANPKKVAVASAVLGTLGDVVADPMNYALAPLGKGVEAVGKAAYPVIKGAAAKGLTGLTKLAPRYGPRALDLAAEVNKAPWNAASQMAKKQMGYSKTYEIGKGVNKVSILNKEAEVAIDKYVREMPFTQGLPGNLEKRKQLFRDMIDEAAENPALIEKVPPELRPYAEKWGAKSKEFLLREHAQGIPTPVLRGSTLYTAEDVAKLTPEEQANVRQVIDHLNQNQVESLAKPIAQAKAKIVEKLDQNVAKIEPLENKLAQLNQATITPPFRVGEKVKTTGAVAELPSKSTTPDPDFEDFAETNYMARIWHEDEKAIHRTGKSIGQTQEVAFDMTRKIDPAMTRQEINRRTTQGDWTSFWKKGAPEWATQREGLGYKGNLFRTDTPGVTIGRMAAGEAKIANEQFFRITAEKALGAEGAPLAYVKGTSLEQLKKTIGPKAIEYKQLPFKGIAEIKDPALLKKLGVSGSVSFKDLYFHPDVARVTQRAVRARADTAIQQGIKDAAEKLMAITVKGMLYVSPGYYTRNVFGSAWKAYLAGVEPLAMVLRGKEAVGMSRGDWNIWKAERGESAEKLWEYANKNGIWGGGWAQTTARELGTPGAQPGKLAQVAGKLPRAAQYSDNVFRMTVFLDNVKKGKTLDEARDITMKWMGDFSKLETMNKWGRLVFPFIRWHSYNIPNEIMGMATRPTKYTAAYKIGKNIEKAQYPLTPDQEKTLNDIMSKFQREGTPLRIGKDKDGNPILFLMGSWWPPADVINMVLHPIEFGLHYPERNIWPFVKTYQALTRKYDPETGRKIEGEKVFLGRNMNTRAVDVARNFPGAGRSLGMLDTLNPGGVFGTLKEGKQTRSYTAGMENQPVIYRETPGLGNRIAQASLGKVSMVQVEKAKGSTLWEIEREIMTTDSKIDQLTEKYDASRAALIAGGADPKKIPKKSKKILALEKQVEELEKKYQRVLNFKGGK